MTIGPDDMDEMSKELFEESGRPAITITSQVSDNRSVYTNAVSVSFQIPVRTPEKNRRGPDGPSHQSSQQAIDPGTPWMRPLEQQYYNTARSSVVAEVRARHRSKMLMDLSDRGIVAPWALHVAPMPVYLHPHAEKIADIMQKQALDFQRQISNMLHDHSVFQSERIAVDKVSLHNIFSLNEEGYKKSVGALFDSRIKVQHDMRDQMQKYIDHLTVNENQVSKKELASLVRGKVPANHSFNTNVALSTEPDDQPDQPVGDRRIVIKRDRSRSRGRSTTRKGRSRSRNDNQRRPFNNNNGYNQNPRDNYQPQRDYYNRDYDQPYNRPRQQQQDSYQDGGRQRQGGWQNQAPPRPRYQDEPHQRMETNQMHPSYFTPDIIRRIAEAYDGLHQ